MTKSIKQRRQELKKYFKYGLQELFAIYRDSDYDDRNLNEFLEQIQDYLKENKLGYIKFYSADDIKLAMKHEFGVDITETKTKKLFNVVANNGITSDFEFLNKLNELDQNHITEKDCEYPGQLEHVDEDDEPVEMRKAR